MKRLIDYIFNTDKEDIERDICEITFEDFCKENFIDIENISEDGRKNAELRYINSRRGLLFDQNSYEDYQAYLYETLLNTGNPYRLKQKLEDKFEKYIHKIVISNNSGSSYQNMRVYGDVDIFNDKNFHEILHSFNYEANEIKNDKDEHEYIYIKPILTEDISKQVFSYPVIYHFTPQFIYEEKIKNYGLSPKIKRGTNIERTYLFYTKHKDPKFVIELMADQKYRNEQNEYKKEKIDKKFVLLTIDTKKLNNKIRFFEDDEADGFNAFYTFEFIPASSIINVEYFKTR